MLAIKEICAQLEVLVSGFSTCGIVFFFALAASSQRQVVIAAAFRPECAAPVPTVHQHLSPGPVPILHQLLWTSADLLLSWGAVYPAKSFPLAGPASARRLTEYRIPIRS